MSSSQYEEQGVQFKVISPDMYEDVMDFLWTHFFPVAPVSRTRDGNKDESLVSSQLSAAGPSRPSYMCSIVI